MTQAQTRGERMLALRRARMAASPAVLRGGFRPFFLGAAAWAFASLPIWLLALSGLADVPSAFDPLAWHRHEMLFGFVGAVVAGFLLTAIPNWTGRLPIAGGPLLSLFGLWLAARAAMYFSAISGLELAATLDVGFYLVLAAVAGREVLAAKNRNLPIVLLVLLFAGANFADYAVALGVAADEGLGWRAGLALVVLMISLIGGRIIPSFTRNWLVKQGITSGLPGQPTGYDLTTIAVTAVALAAWLAAPEGHATGVLSLAAAALQLVRLSRWRGWRTFRDPLVLILHIGYFWVPLGLGLLAASNLGTAVPRSTAIHALTAGAMATMILAVMTRATLGHTGRELKAHWPTTLLYALVTLGAVIRVAAPLEVVDYMTGIWVSGAAWVAAFTLFLAAYGPMLFRPRSGES